MFYLFNKRHDLRAKTICNKLKINTKTCLNKKIKNKLVVYICRMRVKNKKGKASKKKHLFIDESGSPDFYGSKKKLLIGDPNTPPILILGLIETRQRSILRNKIIDFKSQLLKDPSLKHINSLHQNGWYLHARGDHPKVRDHFFEFMQELDFTAHAVIGRKKLKIFHDYHKAKTSEFYFDLVKHLLKDRFKHEVEYELCLSGRSSSNANDFAIATKRALDIYSKKLKNDVNRDFKCIILKSSETPELSVVDYALWALQRYILKGQEKHFESLKNKYGCILDLYQNKKQKRYYTRKSPLTLENIEPFTYNNDTL